MPEGKYRVEDIQVLSPCEAVRLRVKMYVGDPEEDSALTTVLLEPLCLAIDEQTWDTRRRFEASNFRSSMMTRPKSHWMALACRSVHANATASRCRSSS